MFFVDSLLFFLFFFFFQAEDGIRVVAVTGVQTCALPIFSEVLTGPVVDPVVGLAWAGASNPRVKLGTTMLLPGRNVVRLAKQLARLDVLCRGRLLVTLVPGLTYAPEREAIGVEPKRRGAFIDEALPLLRRLWA